MKPIDYLYAAGSALAIIVAIPIAVVAWLVAAALMACAFAWDCMFTRR